MSVQFGRWNLDGTPVDPGYLDKVISLLGRYGPDHACSHSKNNVSILYFAFHTTRESRLESQPHVTSSGNTITWDGRLDNRAELIDQLRGFVTANSTDLEIVSAAYELRGEDCFAVLIGDWSLSIWNPHTCSLILAKDPIGARNLFYSFDDRHVSWSTILDPLVLLAGKSFKLSEEYIAGWFSMFPASHLTPYVDIQSVPPSSRVLMHARARTVRKYWDFDPSKRIRYRTDGEYEEHFRAVFSEAVRRRLRSDSPVLAELSGGVDASSIVCVADTILASGSAGTPRLDTISYYDDSEPHWNERAFFTTVEEKRGRTGSHIDIGKQPPVSLVHDIDCFAATPGSAGDRDSESNRQIAECIASQGNRVVLSGIGGDEVTGGVPTPLPEIEDLVARGDIGTLARQLKLWALDKRKPWFQLLFDAIRGFFPAALAGAANYKRSASWMDAEFARKNSAALSGYPTRLKVIGPRPSFQENLSTLESLQRQLGCEVLRSSPCYEKSYPYLDRNFLEFIYAVPREQLVRPGQRRSLTRRALAGIVPDAVLNRKRKAFVTRSPVLKIVNGWNSLLAIENQMVSASLGIVDARLFFEELKTIRSGLLPVSLPILRAIGIERWLRNIVASGVFVPAAHTSVKSQKTISSAQKEN